MLLMHQEFNFKSSHYHQEFRKFELYLENFYLLLYGNDQTIYEKIHFSGLLKHELCQLSLLLIFWPVYPKYIREHLIKQMALEEWQLR